MRGQVGHWFPDLAAADSHSCSRVARLYGRDLSGIYGSLSHRGPRAYIFGKVRKTAVLRRGAGTGGGRSLLREDSLFRERPRRQRLRQSIRFPLLSAGRLFFQLKSEHILWGAGGFPGM